MRDDEASETFPRPIMDSILNAGDWIVTSSHAEKAVAEWDLISEHARRNGVNSESLVRVMLNYVHLVSVSSSDYRSEHLRVFKELSSPKRKFDYAEQHWLIGTANEITDRLVAYTEIGFNEIILVTATGDSDILD